MKPSSKRTLKKAFLNITAGLCAIVFTGNVIAGECAGQINSALGTATSKVVSTLAEGETEGYARYFESKYNSIAELKAAELTPLTAVLKEHDAKIREKQRAVTAHDPAYIISSSAFRMLVGDLFDLLAQYGYLRNRVLDVKTERQLARLQKNLSGEHPAIRRMYRRWGIPDSTGVTGFDMLESAIRRTHLTPYDPDGSEDDSD